MYDIEISKSQISKIFIWRKEANREGLNSIKWDT